MRSTISDAAQAEQHANEDNDSHRWSTLTPTSQSEAT